MRDVILVVTPVRNGADYLEETILSIVEQRGDFDIHYHLQDGGSTDGTVDIAQTWVERLRENGGRFHGGAPVEMTWVSEPDTSMYGAIQAGFESLFRKLGSLEGRRVAMTWINSDDIFTAGAFQTAMSYLFESPERPWVTGIPSMILGNGTIADVRDAPFGYCRHHLMLGRYDGRSRPFFQQEGTFWTEPLWSSVGGLNRSLRLAGDWDLWRRMAKHATVVTIRAVLAHHRRRPGQLSAEMGRYYAEVDGLRALDTDAPEAPSVEGDIAWVAACIPESGRWTSYTIEMHGAQEIASRGTEVEVARRLAFSGSTLPNWIRHLSGLSGAEEWGRWSDANLAPSVRICAVQPIPPRAVLRLKLGVLMPECNPVVITAGQRRLEIVATNDAREFVFELDSNSPVDVIDVRPTTSFSPLEQGWSQDARRMGVACHWIEIAPRPEPSR